MRIVFSCFLLPSLLVAACGSGQSPQAASDSHAGGEVLSAEQGVASDTEAATATSEAPAAEMATAPPVPAPLLERIAAGMQDFSDEPERQPFVPTTLSTTSMPGGTAYAFRGTVHDETKEVLYLVIAIPHEGGHRIHALDLGSTETVLGGQGGYFTTSVETELESFANFNADGSFVFADIALHIITGRLGPHQGCSTGSQEPTVQSQLRLVCGADDCSAVHRARTIVAPGFELACDGISHNPFLGDTPADFALNISLESEQVLISVVSGSAPAGSAGVFPLSDLGDLRAVLGSPLPDEY